MSYKEIFNKYFKRKLILWLAISVVASIVRYWKKPVEWDFELYFNLFIIGVVFILGTLDYIFYEKTAPKICLELIGTPPLKEFQDIGFTYEYDEQHKLIGNINGFQVVLAPAVNREPKRFLIVLIPIALRDGLEDYFSRFDDLFRLTINQEVVMATATINDYDKTYDFDKLYTSIKKTTDLLLERNIEPLEVIDD